QLKQLGFYYSMKAGVSFGLDDVLVPDEKPALLDNAFNEVTKISDQYANGIITDGERYNKIIDIWTHTTSDVARALFEHLSKSKQGFNSVFMMADSGARGSREQIRQLAGMRGLMAKPQKSMSGQTGEIIESPITANFKEGLSVLEYFISTHGARKGLADTALKTADAGYLTRRLVDVAQDVIVSKYDCGTILGIKISDLKEGEEIIEPLRDRILGRITVDDIYDPQTGELFVESGKEINEEIVDKIDRSIIDTVHIRSPLTCEIKYGVCQLCYGRNLATGKLVTTGEAVGVIAAQSIGEPGTQLTLRTFHIGGAARLATAQSEVKAKTSGTITFSETMKTVSQIDENGFDVLVALGRSGRIEITDDNGLVISKYNVPYGAVLYSKPGDSVLKEQVIFRWDAFSTNILTEYEGTIEFVDIKENETYQEEMDEATGRRHRIVVDSRNRKLNPRINVIESRFSDIAGTVKFGFAKMSVHSKSGKETYNVPYGHLLVSEGSKVKKGTVLAKNIDAVVGELTGTTKFRENKQGNTEITVKGDLKDKTYLIPDDHILLVKDGELVKAKSKLSERTPELEAEFAGKIGIAVNDDGFTEIQLASRSKKSSYIVPEEQLLLVKADESVKKGAKLTGYPDDVVASNEGTLRLESVNIIVEGKNEKKKYAKPEDYTIDISNGDKVKKGVRLFHKKRASYILPVKARLIVDHGEKVNPGDVLVKLPREILKSRDITGGLPRVAELFEARKPKEPAVVTEIDGTVKFGAVKRGIREITIISTDGKTKKTYLIPYGKHVLAHDNDYVDAGERLSEGAIQPHDILRIKGASAVQEYLVNEIQEVYRLQGVRINDKHIEVIVRQMMQRVKIEDPGDTYYLESDLIDKHRFLEENEKISNYGIIEDPGDSKFENGDRIEMYELERLNERLEKQEKKPAKFRPARAATFVSQLLGITQASLSTESFISSASFQETTKVLTEAAIEGKVDHLRGLKENVIIGHLIPAGTGVKKFRGVVVESEVEKEEQARLEALKAREEEELRKEEESVEEQM
ncbi:hypothetical protein ACFL6I_17315, partial [candidate division KSB1 bacterium]